jgi:RNA-binding protein 5/10
MPRFGSISQSRSPGRLIRPLPPAEIIEWPPCFDSEGSAFIFHPASGMFYEELSEFFYDPKAKVYYGVKKGAYFRYDDSKDPPFVETQRADPAQGTPIAPVEPPVTLPPINAPGSLIGKHKIAIKLKTKKLKKPKVAINTATSDNFPMPAVPSKSHKEQIANIEKWKEKQTELKAILPVVSSGVSAAVAEAQIKKTAKGEPICVICKRKFPTMEKLRLHEIMSELHKSNLAKAAQQLVGEKRKHEEVRVTKEKQQQQQQYHDRAEKRRHLHGPETATAQRPVFASRGLLGKPDGPEGLGENNIGNKLLQKLGWQSGSSVGRKGDGETSEKSLVEELRKDWDRIEAIADKGAR